MLRPSGGLRRYLDGGLLLDIKEQVEAELREDLACLKPEEAAVLSLLQERLSREVEKQAEKKPAKKRRASTRQETGRGRAAGLIPDIHGHPGRRSRSGIVHWIWR